MCKGARGGRGLGRKKEGEGREGRGEEEGDIMCLLPCTHLSCFSCTCKSPFSSSPTGLCLSSSLMHWLVRLLRCKKRPRNRYKHILADIEPMWPPVEVEGDNKGGIQTAC